MADPFAARRCRSRRRRRVDATSLLPDRALLIRAQRGPLRSTTARVDGRARRRAHDLALYLGAQATWYRRFTSVRGGTEGEPGIRPDPAVLPRGDPARTGEHRHRSRCPLQFRDRLFAELGIRHDWLDDVDRGRLFSYRVAAPAPWPTARGSGATAGGGRRPTTGRHWRANTTRSSLTEADEGGSGHRRPFSTAISTSPDGLPGTSSDVLLGEPASSPSWPVGRSRITDVPR